MWTAKFADPPNTHIPLSMHKTHTQCFDRFGRIGLFIFEARPATIDRDGIPFGLMLRVEPCPPSRHLCPITSKNTRIQNFRQPSPIAPQPPRLVSAEATGTAASPHAHSQGQRDRSPAAPAAPASAPAAAPASTAQEGQAGLAPTIGPPTLLAFPGLATMPLSEAEMAEMTTQPLSLSATDPSFAIFGRGPATIDQHEWADDGAGASSSSSSPVGSVGSPAIPPAVDGPWKGTADSPPPLYVTGAGESGAASPEARGQLYKKPRLGDGDGGGAVAPAGSGSAAQATEGGEGPVLLQEPPPPVLDDSVWQVLAEGWESE